MVTETAGALVDRNPEDASRTAKKAAIVLGNEFFGSVILSTVAGYVDTAGFMALYGLFTAHVTGDLITAAATMAEGPNMGAGVRLIMIPIFMVSVALITLFARAIRRRGADTLPPLLSLMFLALILFGGAGVMLAPYATHADAWAVALIGGIGVAAMGIQNALMKGALRSFAQTTIMTGNLTQLTIDLVDFLFPAASSPKEKEKLREEAARHVRKSGVPLLGFMVGAGLGAGFTKEYGLWSIALPALAVGILALVALIRSRVAHRRAR
jgi:uncharacterized membrane protein YoaK (UPF0700 family)